MKQTLLFTVLLSLLFGGCVSQAKFDRLDKKYSAAITKQNKLIKSYFTYLKYSLDQTKGDLVLFRNKLVDLELRYKKVVAQLNKTTIMTNICVQVFLNIIKELNALQKELEQHIRKTIS